MAPATWDPKRVATITGAVAILVLAAAPAPARAQAPVYETAAVLVSGFHSSSPFTTPDPSCAGKEGQTWSVPNSVPASLRAAGVNVFTAPVGLAGAAPAPCAPNGGPVPPEEAVIDSQAGLDANGDALAQFLAFLRDSYGVRTVNLVGHSDGGMWSRSALTANQPYLGVRVASLTTLGTPHTGSFIADLGIDSVNGKCDLTDPVEQRLCELVHDLLVAVAGDLGSAAIEEATHEYTESWNEQQSIGACPVTAIAGTYVEVPFVPLPFYTPSDGAVGEASALAQASRDLELDPIPAPAIPGLREGGTFPVVHSSVLSFISPNNLLNQAPISTLVAQTVGAAPADSFCNVTSTAASRRAPGSFSARLPLILRGAPRADGRLGRPDAGEAVVVAAGTRVTCGRHPLTPVSIGGDARVAFVLPGACRAMVRARGPAGGRGRALLLHRHPRSEVEVKARGRRVRVRVRGAEVNRLRASVRTGRRWRALDLGKDGSGNFPAADRVAIRVRAETHPGRRLATATVSLGPR